MSELSHVAGDGSATMVDVSDKEHSARSATATARVRFHEPNTLGLLRTGAAAKGDVLATARIAGILAAKRTAELIPLCHPLPLDHVAVDFELLDDLPGLRITASARCRGATGVEMEALSAVSVAALTVIDMLKSTDRWITVEDIGLLEKSGGRHGRMVRPPVPR
jgi:cyclic pyranopterin phosphate synthase